MKVCRDVLNVLASPWCASLGKPADYFLVNPLSKQDLRRDCFALQSRSGPRTPDDALGFDDVFRIRTRQSYDNYAVFNIGAIPQVAFSTLNLRRDSSQPV